MSQSDSADSDHCELSVQESEGSCVPIAFIYLIYFPFRHDTRPRFSHSSFECKSRKVKKLGWFCTTIVKKGKTLPLVKDAQD